MSKPIQLKQIQTQLNQFHENSLHQSSLELFEVLGYKPKAVAENAPQSLSEFCENLNETEKLRSNPIAESLQTIQLLFQLQDSDFQDQMDMFNSVSDQPDLDLYQSYLFIGVRLEDNTYTRTQLNQLTRDVNKLFAMPVMLVFSYGTHISLAIIHRRLHKRDDSLTVLEKVTLIKDINCPKPHRANVEILYDLSLHNLTANNFEELHQAWQKVLDTKELNKKFYRELSNWYAYALNHIQFPDDDPEMKDTDIRNSTNLIRLITRVIFIWFIKEKNLVPYDLFDEHKLENWIADFKQADSHNYYNAVLQNLFFGTLNQNIHERKFAKEGKFNEQRKEYGVNNLFRYKKLWKLENEAEIVKLFQSVPFLNGGLFDCLDYENEAKKKVYVDGFSRNKKKCAQVPDHLFFSPEFEADLNSFYDPKSKKIKKYKISGLINILDRYKFTVTENTPLDQEIALDPELLGRVFENLLASYNPETKTTARKQTGSFYTPREIVDYMVGESLLQYLLTYLQKPDALTEIGKSQTSMFANEDLAGQAKLQISHRPQINSDELENQLRQLINYENDQAHPFTPEQVKQLIEALDNCKILDPACGSGAFPMGVLQRMVFVLTKLDPDNEQWKNRQIEKVDKAIKNIEQMEDIANRDKILKGLHQSKADIETAFDNNELDYGRKLYLIENCIYGLDIQPIAVQISKLRFFISLVVHQNPKPQADQNYGIRALPNLETKFVAANTLISLNPDQQQTLESDKLYQLKKQYKELRKDHFTAKTRSKKIAIQRKDKALRQEINTELQNLGFPANAAQKVADWQPYNQNKAAKWFDANYMMNVEQGFDIVIGNPPYVQLQKAINDEQKLADLYKDENYKTFQRTGDIYCLFYEQGIEALNANGILTFITSNKWMRAKYGASLRKYLSKKQAIYLLDLGPDVFSEATVDTNILVVSKTNKKQATKAITLSPDVNINHIKTSDFSLLENLNEESWVILSPTEQAIKDKIEAIGTPLKKWDISINFGIKTGLNEAFIINEATKNALIKEDPKSAEILKPILRGRDIKRYKAEYADLWIIATLPTFNLDIEEYPVIKKYLEQFLPKIKQTGESFIDDNGKQQKTRKKTVNKWFETQDPIAYYNEFKKEKIIWKRIGSKMRFSYSTDEIYCLDSTCIATGEHIKFLTGYLNSKLGLYQLFKTSPKTGTGDQIISVQALEPLFVAPPCVKIESLVTTILQKKSEGLPTDSEESEIDLRVYKLYGLTYEEVCIVEPDFGMSRAAYESYEA